MPWLDVPIHKAFSRSRNNVETFRVLPSNSGVTNGFQAPCTIRCSPRPRPAKAIPTHTEPSGLAASPLTPSIPSIDFNPQVFVLDGPRLQRTTVVSLPTQRFPRASSTRANAALEPGSPFAFP